MGIIPACFTTLDWLRVESYLLFYPYDMSQMYPFEKDPPGDSLWELGLDFTVSPGKNDFRGADAHARLKGKERFKIFGLLHRGQDRRGHGRCGLFRRQESGRRHLRHGLEPHRQVDGASRASTSPSRSTAPNWKCAARISRGRRSPIPCRSTIPKRRSGQWDRAPCKPNS